MRLRIRRLDRKNLVIEKSHTTKKGEIQWTILGYYGSSIHLVQNLIDMTADVDEGDDLKELAESLITIVDERTSQIVAQLAQLQEQLDGAGVEISYE